MTFNVFSDAPQLDVTLTQDAASGVTMVSVESFVPNEKTVLMHEVVATSKAMPGEFDPETGTKLALGRALRKLGRSLIQDAQEEIHIQDQKRKIQTSHKPEKKYPICLNNAVSAFVYDTLGCSFTFDTEWKPGIRNFSQELAEGRVVYIIDDTNTHKIFGTIYSIVDSRCHVGWNPNQDVSIALFPWDVITSPTPS
jgi:hypothetical protein